MEISETKKTGKYVPLITYLIAVVCLLLGLFLPLFDGKNILALQLPGVLNSAFSKELISTDKVFSLPFPIDLFGLGKVTFDIMAWAVLVYVAVTAISILALIPVIICTVKEKPAVARAFAYVMETAAVLVLSLYVVLALELYEANIAISYNMLIALGGALLALILLNLFRKKGTGVLKTLLFLLSAVCLIALFDFGVLIPSLADKIKVPFLGAEDKGSSGITFLQLLFQSNYTEYLNLIPETKFKAASVLSTILGLTILINYIIDVISLSTNAKKLGLKFNIVRYGVEVAAAVALLITAAICKYKIGIMLIIIAVVAVVALAVNVLRLLLTIRREKAEEFEKEFIPPVRRQPTMFAPPVKKEEPQPVTPIKPAPARNENVIVERPVLMERLEPVPTVTDVVNSQPVTEYKSEPEYNVQPKPIAPARPPVQDIKPVQPVRQEPERYTPPQPVQPVQPVQAVQPTQPAQPVQTTIQPATQPIVQTNDPSVETRIYTINTIYGGPTDDFIRKLSNDEKIEFARTFIEKSKGEIGNIPDYVIGGNNRMFFSSVFIYLGRIRGLISDNLLNKMYKELNMM